MAVVCGMSLQNAVAVSFYPATDPANTGNWQLLTNMSDEFDGTQVDETKWLVQGRNGQFQSNFKGRGYTAASGGGGWQFSPNNVRVESGLLKITTQYEPGYPWIDLGQGTNDFKFTTGGVITKQTFLYGYMEIRCQAANASTTGAFWTTGSGSELDVFEAVGKPSVNLSRTNKMWSSIHDWQLPSTPNTAWTATTDLPFSFGDGFHVYGAEWDETSVKFYADGQLITTATKAWVEANGIDSKRWPLTGGQYVWADSEIFPWWGVPNTNDLPADYQIDYIRVWQKGPAFLWPQFVALYGLSGVKTNQSDADGLNDWAEYVFGGNPTSAADIGVLPVFDAATGGYTYQIRNDASLIARVLTTTNLSAPNWSTNATVNVAVNDGSMGTHTTTVGISQAQLFIKLMVEAAAPPVAYPASKGNNTADEWIASVNIGSLHRNSGSDGGYYDGTAISTTATKGATVSVSLTPGFAWTLYGEVWRVWIDLNHDGDFADAGETVFSSASSSTTVSGSFTLPSTYSYAGPTRMRVSMRYNSAPPSDANFTYGEVEDYTVNIQ